MPMQYRTLIWFSDDLLHPILKKNFLSRLLPAVGSPGCSGVSLLIERCKSCVINHTEVIAVVVN